MKSSRSTPAKMAISMRLNRALVMEMREFIRDHAGKPLYLNPSKFLEAAIAAHLHAVKKRLEEIEKSGDRNVNHR